MSSSAPDTSLIATWFARLEQFDAIDGRHWEMWESFMDMEKRDIGKVLYRAMLHDSMRHAVTEWLRCPYTRNALSYHALGHLEANGCINVSLNIPQVLSHANPKLRLTSS